MTPRDLSRPAPPPGACGSVVRACFLILAAATWTHSTYVEDFARTNRDAEMLDSEYPELTTGPFFLAVGSRNITTTVGQTAYLHCRVSQLGDLAQVSWIRKRDLHVMSSGMVVFASDQRFQVIHPDKSENWTLQIKYAQLRDAGVYECQVNTEPKIFMSYVVNVVESRAVIVGPELVKAGSTINLTCIINQLNMQGLVYWYHDREILDYEGPVKITTRVDQDATTSHLTIKEATPKNSGNYTCWPTSAHAASVVINVVVEGEQPAAMQTGRGNSSVQSGHGTSLLLVLLQTLALHCLINLLRTTASVS